jgi:GNAT superfamily N-acetyltransferase
MNVAALASGVARPSTVADWSDAAALLHDHLDWMRTAARFEPLDAQPALADEIGDLRRHYDRVDRALFVARARDITCGVVALQWHADRSVELKRMYVRPIARGTGVADDLVRAVLVEAEQCGAAVVWLETLRGAMDRAISVYRRNGFEIAADDRRTLHLDGIVVMERRIDGGTPC